MDTSKIFSDVVRLYYKTKLSLIQQRKIARRIYYRAIRRGELQKPSFCEKCGSLTLSIHGHHKDYNKPLDVEWLCNRCHGQEGSKFKLIEATEATVYRILGEMKG